MTRKERLVKVNDLVHDVNQAVLEGRLPTYQVITVLEMLLQGKEKEWWEEEKRYQPWVLVPVDPDLLRRDEDNSFEKAFWKKTEIPNLQNVPQKLVGAEIYFHLYITDLLPFTPSIEALDFYENNPELREKVWDRTEHWVFAWRDAVVSRWTQHHILVPGMYVSSDGKTIIRKWITLHDIYKKKYKVLYRM